jgi:hypothetical protein
MRYSLLLLTAFSATMLAAAEPETGGTPTPAMKTTVICTPQQQGACPCDCPEESPIAAEMDEMPADAEPFLSPSKTVRINVVGQGVAPMTTSSPAQAYALAKRAAIADAYRLIAEKVKGVRVEGQDLIKNMMVKRSTVRTYVDAMIRDANLIETTFKEGLCEVEMELLLSYSQFVR